MGLSRQSCDTMIWDTDLPFIFYPFAGAILGLIIGSFIATLIVRWPEERSVMTGRSQCDSCGRQLRAMELIPVISHILQRGQCRSCAAPISRHHLSIELASGLIGGIALFVAPNIEGMTGALFGWLLLALAALDAEHHWLPDRLTALLAATGLLSALYVESPTIVDRLIGGLIGYFSLLLIAIIYRTVRGREGLGGGDPKMLGAIGFWLGWQSLPLILLGASLVGLSFVLLRKARGQRVGSDDLMPLGSLMAIAAFPLWLIHAGGGVILPG